MKKRGQVVNVYLNDRAMRLYQLLKKCTEDKNTSVSELMRRGMECVLLEQECNVQIAPSAYFAMQDGRFDVITRTILADGTVLVAATEESGYDDKVQTFLESQKG